MGFTEKNLHKSKYPLIGFGGKRIEALGKIELNVTFGEGNTQRIELKTFDVVNIAYPYNAIFGRNSIIKFVAVINQAYLCMKSQQPEESSRSSATKKKPEDAKTTRRVP